MARPLPQAESTVLKKRFPAVYSDNRGLLTRTAEALGISLGTLETWLAQDEALQAQRRAIDKELDEAVQDRLYDMALGAGKGGSAAAPIFWLKARAGWRDRQEITHKGLDFGGGLAGANEDQGTDDAGEVNGLLRVIAGDRGAPPDPAPPDEPDGTLSTGELDNDED